MTGNAAPPPAKKPYQPPKLTVYGNLATLTQANVGLLGRNDHLGGPFKTA